MIKIDTIQWLWRLQQERPFEVLSTPQVSFMLWLLEVKIMPKTIISGAADSVPCLKICDPLITKFLQIPVPTRTKTTHCESKEEL